MKIKKYEIENMAINILNLEGKIYSKIIYLKKVIWELYQADIDEYDFEAPLSKSKNYFVNEEKNIDTITEILKILDRKGRENNSIKLYFNNLLRNIMLNGNLKLDKKVLVTENIFLTTELINELKREWRDNYDTILKNYFLCYIFNKNTYYNLEFFMLKGVILLVFLKLRMMLNMKYLKRDLKDDELTFIIYSHEEDFIHDGEFFNEYYKELKEKRINIGKVIESLLRLL